MDSFLPKGFEPGRSRPSRQRSMGGTKLSVEAAGVRYPVLRRWSTGFAISEGLTPKLRGVVNLYDGADELGQCLITGSEVVLDEVVFTTKTSSGYNYGATSELQLGAHGSV